MSCIPVALDDRAFMELGRAAKRDGHDWKDICDCLAFGSAQVWNVNDEVFVLTVANDDGTIDVLLAGGRNARANLADWEAVMMAHPAHKGMTLRVEGRKGWQRILKHWNYRDGILTLDIGG